jgi:hydrogenase nickel incorporation protein HypA/HybF
MHETSLAKQILNAVLERAEGRRVRLVRGSIAEDEALSAEALAFHFRAHAQGSVAEFARLELELLHLSARCGACATVFLPDHHVRLCPACGSTDAVLEGHPGVHVEDIEVEAE